MTQHVIGFFCGTGYTTLRDDCFQGINDAKEEGTVLLGYDGCQVKGGGIFAYGVEEQANAFLEDFKSLLNHNEGNYQLNLVAHSRGVLSALMVIKKIQADDILKNKVKITGDFRDPVPGNFQLTTQVAGNLAIANQVRDLSDCDIVKKIYITLQEKPISSVAFDGLIPKFHYSTRLEIETLPGYHDVQQREGIDPVFENSFLYKLGFLKTKSILIDDGHKLKRSTNLINEQLNAYVMLVPWVISRRAPFGERDLHFGGNITANSKAKTTNGFINWRHAQLIDTIPENVLYGTTHPHYNFRKTQLELFCDLALALDRYVENNVGKSVLTSAFKQISKFFLRGEYTLENYIDRCHKFIKLNAVKHLPTIKAINYNIVQASFANLDKTIIKNVPVNNALFESLTVLKHALAEELTKEIESATSVEQIEKSNAFKIINNTIKFVDTIYSEQLSAERIFEISQKYVNDNISYGRNWSNTAKLIAGALVCVAATVVGCVLGAAIGVGIGFATGVVSGPGAFITALVAAFIGGLEVSMVAATYTGAALGLGAGVYCSNHFFNPAASEKQVQQVASLASIVLN